ncbi:hypothetical protein OO007_18870 [Cocleimonas sp. KMM 6892]|uniref:hypothetical protein n=1 Tax=unclassified Cocleimonas TaxID=2639732 RepID=UPI002DBF8D80|nr:MULTISPECIES: hypothetical protein [unclassified Cocleimonas]MEB8434308.1 hypothetical protein [Cocleimonas sp. KMM 6892]MEC4717289.1 hypothetical protein [Cocleimonas sp. KMM 6895]MEC4746668.1 hypothetical protein [Cocleimonas sp. KMM 6896]
MKYNKVTLGFIAAAMMNIGGVLIFSRAFTNSVINEFDPVVMSNFGLLMIVVWGLAYLSAATITSGVKWLAGAFAIEKLVYVVVWLLWFKDNSLGVVYEQDLFAGMFYSIYGLNDFVFMLFFAWVFLTEGKSSKSLASQSIQ